MAKSNEKRHSVSFPMEVFAMLESDAIRSRRSVSQQAVFVIEEYYSGLKKKVEQESDLFNHPRLREAPRDRRGVPVFETPEEPVPQHGAKSGKSLNQGKI